MKKFYIPAVLGVIPGIIGIFLGGGNVLSIVCILSMLLIFLVNTAVLCVFGRGAPDAMISARAQGGMMWGIVKTGKRIAIGKVDPKGGMITTKHGTFNVMSSDMWNMDGVPIGFSPEKTGYNVGFDRIAIVNILKARGISNITDVCDVDEYGYFKNWKDDERIKDLKADDETIKALRQKYTHTPGVVIDLSGFDDFYKYQKEAANPYHQDAQIKQGISQGLFGKTDKTKMGMFIAGMAAIAIAAFVAIVIISGQRGEVVIRTVVDNASHVIGV